jgi:hypothetical protein
MLDRVRTIAHAIPAGWDDQLERSLRDALRAWSPAPGRLAVHGLERAGDELLLFTDPEPVASLKDAAECAGELAPAERIAWAVTRTTELAQALEGYPFPHRDVTSTSTALADDGTAVLYPPLRAALLGRPRMGAGVLRGSFHFFSPELARGTTVTRASDVYQLGMTLRFLLRAPLHEGDALQVLTRIVNGEQLPSLRAGGLDAPAELDDVLTAAIASDPRARPADPAAFAAALGPFAVDRPEDRAAIARAARARALADGATPRGSRIEDGPIVEPCKMQWEDLAPTADPAVRDCARCKLTVRRATTELQLVPLLGRSCTFWDPS